MTNGKNIVLTLIKNNITPEKKVVFIDSSKSK